MTTVAFVFARGGSRGLSRKNLRLLAGKPLLAHAIEAARAATLVDRVIVSTEDEEIAETARIWGAEVLDRPPELATDEAPEWLCWQHAVRRIYHDPGTPRNDPFGWTFVCVPCTAPLRIPEDIDAVIRRLRETDADAVITVTKARRNPYFNQVCGCSDETVQLVFARGSCAFSQFYSRRQDAPPVYDVATVAYAARPEFVLSASGLWEGRVRVVEVPPERAIDIDMELDLRIAGFLMGERLPHPFPAGILRHQPFPPEEAARLRTAWEDSQTPGRIGLLPAEEGGLLRLWRRWRWRERR